MSTSESRSAVVMELAEEFLESYRQGQRPSLKNYIDRHPELASEIREVFPAMAMMENIAIHDDSLDGEATEAPAPSPRKPPLPEQIGDFRIIREIGHGGMGVVYEAEQVSLGRHVALKILPSQMVRDHKQRLRFEREAKAAAKLHHSNIVPVFGVGEHDGTAYYVMQFIQGLGLDEVIEELRKMRPGGPGFSSHAISPAARNIRRDVTAADVARSLLTGVFNPLEHAGLLPDGVLAATVTTAPSDGTAPQSENKTDGAPSQVAPEPSPSGSGSSSSVVLPGASGSGASRSGRPATYWQSVARVGLQVAEALEYCAQAGHPPPRHQALEPVAGYARDRLGDRLRLGQGRRPAEPDPHRRHPGHAPLHAAGGLRRQVRRPGRRLLAGALALRDAGVSPGI